MNPEKKIYFASDIHLGLPTQIPAEQRERYLVQWLEEIQDSTAALFLVGDIFDYWFEYKYVIPKGFTRFLGKITSFTDRGIPVYFFTGNHDVWMFDYFPGELGVTVHHEPLIYKYGGKRFYIAHGDGLGPGDGGYKLLKKIFTSPILQWSFKRLHPNFATRLAHFWSRSGRDSKDLSAEFQGEDKEILIRYAKNILKQEHFDYFIFGHRHLPLDFPLKGSSRVIYLGDWISHFSYAVFDGTQLALKYFKP